ncbi:DUF58 domain-containing protein [Vibrio sp. FNV 38]|nr:DUF58 domain-containing protein [Vibrio sp. FNV 38]
MSIDHRVYPSIERLTELSRLGRQLSWHPPFQRMTPLTGKHKSQQRGRGLDFIELRHYYPGDDVRCIDWKVTQRTRQPYLRVYSQENDKNITFLIDLRNPMFFASDGSMKSVIAAELVAIVSGATNQEGDRFGGVIITNTRLMQIPFKRGEKALFGLLNTLVDCAQQLPNWESDVTPPTLHQALEYLVNLGVKDSQCFIMSDFHDYDQKHTSTMISNLARRNSLIGFRITDPIEAQFPQQDLVVGNSEYQIEIKEGNQQLRADFADYIQRQKEQIAEHFMSLRLALLEITTHQEAWTQLHTFANEAHHD